MATLLSDAFTGTDGTSLSGRAMSGTPGKSWTAAGTWTISSNTAVYGGSGSPYMSLVSNANAADVVLTCDMIIPSAANYLVGVAFRFVDGDNTWFVMIERDSGGTPFLKVFDRTSGTDTPNANSQNFSGPVSGTTQTLTITTSGNSIDVTCTDVGHPDLTLTTITSSTRNGATKHGLFSYTDGTYAAGAHDNFLVTGTALASSAFPTTYYQQQARMTWGG